MEYKGKSSCSVDYFIYLWVLVNNKDVEETKRLISEFNNSENIINEGIDELQ